MTDEIPICRPWLGAPEERALAEAVGDRWVGQGPRVARFEDRLATLVGADHAVALSSGTAALHLALVAAGVGPGHEVIVPALSFIATANAVRMAGARAVFAEVERATLNLDPADVAHRITPRTRALLVVHQLGLPARMAPLKDLARHHNLRVIEDAACALGSRLHGEPIGRPHGHLACFSFHPRKIITTGEGGAVTTSDQALADRLRTLRNHGSEQDPTDPAQVRFVSLGYNYRMSDLHAAMGLAQLDRLEEILERRAAIARQYDSRLQDSPWLETPPTLRGRTHSYQSYHLTVARRAPLTASQLLDLLASHAISARGGLTAIPAEPTYASPDTPSFPITEELSRQGLFLPIYPELAPHEVSRICDVIQGALGGG